MRYFKLLIMIPAVALAVAVARGDGTYSSGTSQITNDIASRMNDLKIQKASYDSVQADLVLQKKALAGAQQQGSFSAYEDIRSRIEQDQAASEGYVSKMVGDIQYLQSQWDLVSPSDKDFVSAVNKSLK